MTQLQTPPPTAPVVQKLSADDLNRVLSEGGVEYVDGKIEEHSMSSKSNKTMRRVGRLFEPFEDSDDLSVFLDSFAYRCFPEKKRRRKPDVSVIRNSRLREAGFADDDDIGESPVPANLAVEVVSPNDRVLKLEAKAEEYLAAGFDEVWIVIPMVRKVRVLRPDGERMLTADDEITLPDLLPQFKAKVADLFPEA